MLFSDVRHALRLFRRETGFALAAVLTLALGIGANTALFAVVEAVLLRPLPFADADDLVMLRHRDLRTGITKDFVALGDVVDLRARQKSLEVLAGFGGFQSTLLGEGDPVRVEGLAASPDVFRALRVRPALGRLFDENDAREKAPPVVIISHNLWTTRFGSNPNITGRSIQIGNVRRAIVGVAPPGFRFPPGETTDVIVPYAVPASAPPERRIWTHAMGRLRSDRTIDEANIELAALSRQFEQEFPASNRGTQYDVLTIRDAAVGDTRRPLLLLFAAVGFVLLIACANVGNLLLARSLARRQEMATRLALGAGRARIAAQIFTESLVLAIAGGIVGTLVAWQAAPALAKILPQSASIPALEAVSLNLPVLAFSCAASLAAALIFSTVASVGFTGSVATVAATQRTTMNRGARRAASALVVVEVALAVVLLLGAGLTLRSFANLISVKPGFNSDRVLNVQIALPPGRYADAKAMRALYDRAFAALEALPEIEAVGAAVVTPLTGNNWTVPFQRPEHPLAGDERPPDVGWQLASGGFFRALRIPLRAGRLFDERDRPGGAPVVIISESIVARFFPGENPVGRRVTLGENQAEIVGVVGDIRRAALSDEPRADMYFPFEAGPGPAIGLFIRTAGQPSDAVSAVRATLRTIEPDTVVYGARTMSEVAAESAAVARLAMQLLGGFAMVAWALAAIGIYGVMSYSVRRRTRELGTRLALGADRGRIIALILRQAAVICGIGLVAGVSTGLAAARSLGAILYGVPSWDPIAILVAVMPLALTALVAAYVPARRAARIDPARALAPE
jgi:putative ABC transport system permease protein